LTIHHFELCIPHKHDYFKRRIGLILISIVKGR